MCSVGLKKENIAEDIGEVNYVSSLPFSLSLFNNVGLRLVSRL